MMKATAWFCPLLLTLLSATRLVCTAQRGVAVGTAGTGAGAGVGGVANGYPLDYLDAQVMQDEYSMAKRNKPSLSIVNPLDVLRQRLLLEIARRQMKENTRQVELNRAILKNVGKRVFQEVPWANSRYQEHQQQQQQQQQLERQQAALREQLRREQLQQQHFPSQLWSIGWPQTGTGTGTGTGSSYTPSSATGSSRFFDFLQRPEAQARHQQRHQQQQQQQQQQPTAGQQLLDDSSKSLGLGLGLGVQDVAKHQQSNGNEIANETNHDEGNRKLSQSQSQSHSAVGKSATGDVEDNVEEYGREQDQEDILDELYYHWATEQPDDIELEEQDNANGRLPWRLFYRMHKNSHYAN